MLFAIIGNSLTLGIIYTVESLRTKTYVFVANLAIADLLVGLLVMPIVLTASISDRWPFVQDWICELSSSMNGQCCLTSIASLCAIAIERYHSIINPLHYESKMSKRNVIILLCWTWIQPFIFIILGLGKVGYVPYSFICLPKWQDNAILAMSVYVLCVFIPILLTSKLYYHICKLTFQHLKRVQNVTTIASLTRIM
ncbi:octopamine receptor beta-2R-like [Antedon mediterranea]|uniref:octopamine receptor beta-2R-like n=1 Tax=Antedon mediterranea TaxID=105859 RepID=UPI003AF6E098